MSFMVLPETRIAPPPGGLGKFALPWKKKKKKKKPEKSAEEKAKDEAEEAVAAQEKAAMISAEGIKSAGDSLTARVSALKTAAANSLKNDPIMWGVVGLGAAFALFFMRKKKGRK